MLCFFNFENELIQLSCHMYIEPGPVNDLMCSSTDGSDLLIDWTIPDLNAGNVIDYLVEVSQYVSPGDQLVSLFPPFNQQVDGLRTTVDGAGL